MPVKSNDQNVEKEIDQVADGLISMVAKLLAEKHVSTEQGGLQAVCKRENSDSLNTNVGSRKNRKAASATDMEKIKQGIMK